MFERSYEFFPRSTLLLAVSSQPCFPSSQAHLFRPVAVSGALLIPGCAGNPLSVVDSRPGYAKARFTEGLVSILHLNLDDDNQSH